MDAVDYIKARDRMCESYDDCVGCPMNKQDSCIGYPEIKNPEEIVAIVEKWAKENSVKTYKDELLEKFPNATIWKGEILKICREDIFRVECPEHNNCKKCWKEEYKEEHPVKTYLDDFISKFPNCNKDEIECSVIEGLCIEDFYGIKPAECPDKSCEACWKEEYKED